MLIIELLRIKVKHYLGTAGTSIAQSLSSALFYLTWILVVGFVALMLRIYGISVGALLDDFVTALKPLLVASILSVGVFLGMKGGITALSYEVEYVFTSTVRPRTYLISDFLFQFIFLNLFSLPASAVMVTVLTFPRHAKNLFDIFPIIEASILSAILLSHILGMARNWVSRKAVFTLGGVLTLSILLPLLDLFLGWLPGLKDLMLPVNIMMQVMRDSYHTVVVLVYFGCLAVLYFKMSGKLDYSGLAPVLTHVLTDQPKKILNLVKIPTSFSKVTGMRPEDGPLLLLLKIHLTRFLRDGSLWITTFVLLLLVYVNSFLPQALSVTATIEASYITVVSLYTPLIPALLSINWVLTERNNLWMLHLSVHDLKTYAASLLLAYVIVSSVFSTAMIAAVFLLSGPATLVYLDYMLVICSSLFGSFFALVISTSLKKIPSPFSLTSVFLVIVPLVGSQILSLPILVARLFQPFVDNPPPLLPFFLISYVFMASAAVLAVSRWTSKNLRVY
ncbi:MAG: hypothetical protein QXF45_01600 [Candidatus Caldarchaeum sp.]